MKCQNPTCNNEFEPSREGAVYCCTRCRNRAQKIREKERRQAMMAETIATMTHPCKRCGGPAKYRQVYCDSCKLPAQKGVGIAPLTTRHIKSSRRREQALIDAVVAKSLAEGRQGGNDDNYHRRWSCGLKGAKIG